MLKLSGISKTYPKSSVKAVDDLTLEVKSGEIFGFLGPNGAGKSTTIKIITGILKPDSGTVEVNGVSFAANPVAAKLQIGYVPDTHEAFDTLKGKEYLDFVAEVYGLEKSAAEQDISRYAKLFEIEDALGSTIGSYSHGMKQKLFVTAALIHKPDVWILDEPLTGLDPQSAYNLKKIMREFADEGKTVFFSSHVIDVVEKVCDRIAIIDKGKLIAVDTLENIRNAANVSLEQLFLQITSDNEAEK